MSIPVLIIGRSGTGKTTSLRNLDPKNTLLIQPIAKPLPFKSKDWVICKNGQKGNIFLAPTVDEVLRALDMCKKSDRQIIVIDDLQYLFSTMFVEKLSVKGYEKFNELAQSFFQVLKKATQLEGDKRVYLLCHSDTNDLGHTKMKTLGKVVEER